MKKLNLKSLATLGLAVPLASCQKSEERPNIVLFLIDDMGWMDSTVAFGEEVYPNNLRHNTPNMERMAEQGVIMTSAYAATTSSPTRNAIMTGMNSALSRHTLYGAKYKDMPNDGGGKIQVLENDVLEPIPDWNYNGIDPKGVTNNAVHVTPFPQLLKDDGYYTIHIGKAHWAPGGTPAASPLNMGFCVNVGGQIVGRPNSYYAEDNYGNKPEIWSLHATHNMTEYYGTDVHLTDALTLEALKTLDYPIKNNIPFFLNLCHHGVHTPIQPDPRFVQKYIDAGLDKQAAAYASLIEGVDKSLGEVMAYLEEKGVADNTLIILLSDNGGESVVKERGGQMHMQNWPLREGKGSVYEGGIRVPMIVCWGDKIAAGTRINTPVLAEDVYPTILEAAGIKHYKTAQRMDGQNILRLLTKGSYEAKRAVEQGKVTSQREQNRYVVSERISGIDPERDVLQHFPHQRRPETNYDIDYMTSLRKGDWKLVYRHRTQELELYNLADDLSEQYNLATEQPMKLREMAAEMTRSLKERDAQMPIVRATGKPLPYPNELVEL